MPAARAAERGVVGTLLLAQRGGAAELALPVLLVVEVALMLPRGVEERGGAGGRRRPRRAPTEANLPGCLNSRDESPPLLSPSWKSGACGEVSEI